MPPIAAFVPVRRRKIYQNIAEQLERHIRAGRLGDGDELPSERELMKQFEVGRPAVREAMLSLERSGLIALSTGRPARVTRPTVERMLENLSPAAHLMLTEPQGMRDLQRARRLFEAAITREAAACASDADLEVLRQALARNHAARGDAEAFKQTDLEFHLAIAEIVGNPILVALLQALGHWLLEQRTVSLRRPGAEAHAAQAHARIFEAIAAHDPDAASTAMRDHLDETTRLYWLEANAASADIARVGRRSEGRKGRTP